MQWCGRDAAVNPPINKTVLASICFGVGADRLEGCCHSNANRRPHDALWPWGVGLSGERLPLRQGGGATFFEGLAVDDGAFEIEVIMDIGVDAGELSQGL